MSKIALLIITSLLLTTSCGKKGNLQNPDNMKRPKFDNIIAE